MTQKNEIYDQMEWGQLVDANGVPVETCGGNDWGQMVDADGNLIESFGGIEDGCRDFIEDVAPKTQPKSNLFKKIFNRQKVR